MPTALGLDVGSNSIGWSLINIADDQTPLSIKDAGVRIFPKAVEDKTPTPKNVKRRNSRLTRRVIQRRAARRQRMINFLVSLKLLPCELQTTYQPEIILNKLGDPYMLRAKALDAPLTSFELGRVMLHITQRRGFLSNKKVLLGQEMLEDPDVISVLGLEQSDEELLSNEEKTEFYKEISQLKQAIGESMSRTLGEYLSSLDPRHPKRNRKGSFLRTDRQMYMDEFFHIAAEQRQFHSCLDDTTIDALFDIIFFQRPLKLKSDRVGKCVLEPKYKRCQLAKIEFQKFRYLQDINHLSYFVPEANKYFELSTEDKSALALLFEKHESISVNLIKKTLGLGRNVKLNLDQPTKKFKGNVTASRVRDVYSDWDKLSWQLQLQLAEDLITYQQKSALKKRLLAYWGMTKEEAVNLCLVELESGHASYSLKAIRRLLPHLEQGQIFSDARQSAGYHYKKEKTQKSFLDKVPETANPIVNKALHEIKKLVNAVIKTHGKPDYIRVEMARDLEMNTKRYKAFTKQQNDNQKANQQAEDEYSKHAMVNLPRGSSTKAKFADKLKYRLWKDQHQLCAYSNKPISIASLFSADVEIDHILPFSQSLDDSYMNKVLCFARENQIKGQRTPIDAFGGDSEKWLQITRSIESWDKKLKSKLDKFYLTDRDIIERDFISTQLNDTRYITKLTLAWLEQLGSRITTTKGVLTAWMRHAWGLNSLLGSTNDKERNDHRHHTLDAIVTACVSKGFYDTLVKNARDIEVSKTNISIRDIHIDEPWNTFRQDVGKSLNATLVSHAKTTKLTGALHEETGVGFSRKHGGTVLRKNLDESFTLKHAEAILDNSVKHFVFMHMSKFDNKPKLAFSNDNPLFHKDGKTRIKKVRILSAKTTVDKLEATRMGIKNANGDVFKWHTFGNTHHVSISKQLSTDKYLSDFVTMFEAAQRKNQQQCMHKQGDVENQIICHLHANDTVSINIDGSERLFRVTVLDMVDNRLTLLPIEVSGTTDGKIRKSINVLMEKMKMKKVTINVLGKIV